MNNSLSLNETPILTNTDSRLDSIEQRLSIIEQYLTQQSQLQNNSFASFASLHMSNLAVPNSAILNTTNQDNNISVASSVSGASFGGKNKTKSNRKKKSKNQTKRKK
tara:strand:- start:1627 stop:1947 length:321 start_codon:yes stop_codon:yes gene_type:complete